ncbi:Transcription factor [Lachnellula hyalina]|uniref:Transcription factor n=1 Tax=Lachnellula hyalina TaxID=1316788 RepID=A0A8H8TY33_9HELO|nr:Transcription factor [Lachnellula hyalina]TVY23546.1 Transcription factor [Lachnellula hyalina]
MSKRSERADLEFPFGVPSSSHAHHHHHHPTLADASVKLENSPSSGARNKRGIPGPGPAKLLAMSGPSGNVPMGGQEGPSMSSPSMGPPAKKSRTNTPWTPAEEQRLRTMRDAGNSWADIAKTFPQRTEGSVKKHWYKDMHYAEFAEDEGQALLNAIKEYDANKWKAIGLKVGKPPKACEQYAKEHFGKS